MTEGYEQPYWVNASWHPNTRVHPLQMYGTVYATSQEDAKSKFVEYANRASVVRAADLYMTAAVLPYPAAPVLVRGKSDCPPFCFNPRTCGGHTSCPRPYSCSE